MKRWVVEMLDNGQWPLSEAEVQAIIDRINKETPPNVTFKIHTVTGPFAEYGKAAGAR